MKTKTLPTITLDTSVFVSYLMDEINTPISEFLFTFIKENDVKVICPNIVLAEITLAILTNNKDSVTQKQIKLFIQSLINNPFFEFIDVDTKLINTSLTILHSYPLRGMDSLYVAVALAYDTLLITYDKNQLGANSKH